MTAASARFDSIDPAVYKRRIRAWTLYDWANSAFVTTILAAVLPIYYSQVAGSTLPSEAVATSYWSFGLSISLIITAILSPILGTISDVMRGKKLFLAIFAGIGILATATLVFVGTGDWMIASIIAIVGRIGFTGSISFYDALLPHIARPEEQDSVSTRGYAMGYLGGGILLAVNVVMIFVMGFEAGARLSFFSVAIWWFIFSIPLFRAVPEPPADNTLTPGETVLAASFKRLWATVKDIRHYSDLFKFLIAFLIYNDAIGTIIGVAAIYGSELGFGSIELILALLLVQFVGIPFSLIFGRLPDPKNNRRAFYLAFILFSLVALPLVGVMGAKLLPESLTGVLLPPVLTTETVAGTGRFNIESPLLKQSGAWEENTISAAEIGSDSDVTYLVSTATDGKIEFPFNGETIILTTRTGSNYGMWAVLIDNQPVKVEVDKTSIPLVIDSYSPTVRYGVTQTIDAPQAGEHILSLVNTGTTNPSSTGSAFAFSQIEVARPVSKSSLTTIIGIVLVIQVVGVAFADFIGAKLVQRLADRLNTERSILLSLVVYSVIAVWGFFINSTIEFWFLAWMVAIVQGGSQALSRSLFSSMSPASKSGEFFGLFGVMEKFSSFIGPLIFAIAAATLGSSRPAILALIAFFIIGGWLLTRVNVPEGQRIAQAEDEATYGAN